MECYCGGAVSKTISSKGNVGRYIQVCVVKCDNVTSEGILQNPSAQSYNGTEWHHLNESHMGCHGMTLYPPPQELMV